MPLANQKSYTIEDIYNLPEGARAELIDGSLYMMASPSRMHQEIVGELFGVIRDYIKKENGSCKTYVAPFAECSSFPLTFSISPRSLLSRSVSRPDMFFSQSLTVMLLTLPSASVKT